MFKVVWKSKNTVKIAKFKMFMSKEHAEFFKECLEHTVGIENFVIRPKIVTKQQERGSLWKFIIMKNTTWSVYL